MAQRWISLVLSVVVAGLVGACAPGSSADTAEPSAETTVPGAKPDDGQDDSAALAAALRQAAASPSATVVRLAPGRYDFAAGFEGLSVDRARDLTLDGAGAELLFHDAVLPWKAKDCKRVTLRNLTIDFDPLPYAFGEVVEASENHFDVAVFEEFPVRGGEPVQAVIEFDPATRVPAADGVDAHGAVDRTELLAPQRLRLHTQRPVPVKRGRLVALCRTWYGPGALAFEDCRDVRLENVNVHAAYGMGLRTSRCGDVTLKQFRVRVRPGSNRLMSTTADAAHFGGGTGRILIEDSLFEGNGDDAINIKSGLYLAVTERIDDRTVRARHRLGMANPPRPGDVLEVDSGATLLPLGELRVREATLEPNGVHRIAFDEALPPNLALGDVLGNLTTVPKVEIRRCTARNSRARGFLLQTRGVLVEDCTFEHCLNGGISIITELAAFGESITSRDVTIRNNRFTEVNLKPGSTFGVVGIQAFLDGFKLPEQPGVHRDIRLEGNVIRGSAVAGIYAAGVDGLILRGNHISEVCRNPVRDGERGAIDLTATRNVKARGNKVEKGEQGAGCEAPLRLDDHCEESTIVLEDNQGF